MMKLTDSQFNSLNIDKLDRSAVVGVHTTNSYSENPATITKSIKYLEFMIQKSYGDVVKAFIGSKQLRVLSLETNREIIINTTQDLTELF